MTTVIIQIPCQKIISGGQTGVDRGALDACLSSKFRCGGWCPKGRLAEDGVIDIKYPLKETDSKEYEIRTEKNVVASDGTLIISNGELTGGTLLTKEFVKAYKKPFLLIIPSRDNTVSITTDILLWLKRNSISVLNIAGPRLSEWPSGYQFSYDLISSLIYQINKSNLEEYPNQVNIKK